MRILLILLLATLSLCGCKVDEFSEEEAFRPSYLTRMPDKTEIGANTFGCYMNGKLCASRGFFQREGLFSWLAGTGLVNGFWSKQTNYLNGKDTYLMQFKITLRQAFFMISSDSIHAGLNKIDFCIDFFDGLGISAGDSVEINITKLDTLNHIISGEFNAIDIPFYHSESVVQITQGQFDIKYGTNF